MQLETVQRHIDGYRRRLRRKLQLKRIPIFTVKLDETGEQINHIEQLLDQIQTTPSSRVGHDQ